MANNKNKALDVLIIGDGITGCTAALAARKQRANVVIVEKSQPDIPHGNTAFCGGALRRVSKDYSETRYFADIMKVSQGKADKLLTKITIRNSRRAKASLSRLGIRWTAPNSNPGRADSVVGRGATLAPQLRQAVSKAKIPILNGTRVVDVSYANNAVASVKVQS